MYSKEELLIFSFINSNYDISIQNLSYKIFNFSNIENINFFKLNRIEKIEFLKSFFSEDKIEKILFVFDKLALYKMEVEKIIKNCEEKNIKIFYYSYENYPKNLIDIKESPYVIFVKGNLPSNEELEKSFAIVGTRKPSKDGIDFARDIGQYLSKNNIYNISGLALGIDIVGHNMSLQKTGAILGQGLDLEIYPRENVKLAEMILENNGFLLSELIPQTEISLFSLIKRDRLQSALTSGIVIAETGIKGGTVNTFKYAREQKRKIFISDINREFIEKYKKDLIIIKNSLDFEKKLKNNLIQKNLF
ncbi:DNA processing protein DprA [Fusobacterium sp. HMSC064B11]|jgi:Predicted Rossmann fold nucleotide-binding protein involved in DNA uptake|uniref:DNA processing protein DprA n=1 Tax=Fusobacterium nucleatum subsp. polymorphum TaxID=76857 RepID=A0AAC8WDU4_FUSNP|nr:MULTISPECIES: DNA-processing protein DprA [Fusobacterium]ALM93333.1 DNA processing protein DprA [Fusobacterium polymorphum]ALQ42627.1 DNA processing protein DprA [Fusobacterium polymorphum]OFO26869.1 DNA processing protein DprA [Fusobacterium sp. HMSC064B11]